MATRGARKYTTRKRPKRGGKGSTKPRFDAVKRRAFLKAILDGKGRLGAARAVGVDPKTPRRHVKNDPEFANAVSEAEMQAEREKIEEIEDVLFQRAKGGDRTLIQVFLYNRAPDRWQDKRNLHHHFTPDEAARRLSALLGLSGPEELPE